MKPLYMRKLTVTLILANGARNRRVIKAGSGMLLTRNGIDRIVSDHVGIATRAFPGHAFKAVPLRSGDFNIVECSSQPCAQ